MKTKKLTLLCLSMLAAVSLIISSCSKDDSNATQVLVKDRPDINRTINYTVLVVAGETSATTGSVRKSAVETTGATGAVVQVSINGSVSSKTTDVSGQATFTNLVAGLAAVTVELANHTTVDYIVDLYHVDTNMYDNETKRIASTKVVVFPTTGTGMITVSGVVKMQSDIRVTYNSWSRSDSSYTQSPELENAPNGTVITAIVSNTEFSKYVTMLDGSSAPLTDVTYEGITFSGTVDASGNYTISVPSTGMGLAINIYPPKVATDLLYSVKTYSAGNGTEVYDINNNHILANRTVRYIFTTTTPYSVTAYTGQNEIQDITYDNPKITDPDYFGSATY